MAAFRDKYFGSTGSLHIRLQVSGDLALVANNTSRGEMSDAMTRSTNRSAQQHAVSLDADRLRIRRAPNSLR